MPFPSGPRETVSCTFGHRKRRNEEREENRREWSRVLALDHCHIKHNCSTNQRGNGDRCGSGSMQ